MYSYIAFYHEYEHNLTIVSLIAHKVRTLPEHLFKHLEIFMRYHISMSYLQINKH